MITNYKMRLFVAGPSSLAASAVANLKAICDDRLGRYDLDIIDVLEHPDLAEEERITVTPTLVVDAPLPSRRLIGDLSNTPRVLAGLGLSPREPGLVAHDALGGKDK